MQNRDEILRGKLDERYSKIKNMITVGKKPVVDRKVVYILGGQPGSGKSSFYAKSGLKNFISINGDDYRKFHPLLEHFRYTDADEYVKRTQNFANYVTNRLIHELSDEGYNLVVEGTLRTSEVPIKTCKLLKSKNYKSNLVIIACSAEEAWRSTLDRANRMKREGELPRIVPIDKYNETVQNISNNIEIIKNELCFDTIKIIDRKGNIFYDMDSQREPGNLLNDILKLDEWNEHFNQHKKEYIQAKISVLQQELNEYEK